MSLDAEKLVRMAKQIGANLNYGESPAVVADKVAGHIQKFWNQAMRNTLRDYARQNPEVLTEELHEAISKLD